MLSVLYKILTDSHILRPIKVMGVKACLLSADYYKMLNSDSVYSKNLKTMSPLVYF
jgi:hypothetical protein